MPDKEEVHSGHRKRVWEKFSEKGLSVFNEHEIMEIILYSCLPRVNTNETAHLLINKFGSIKNCLKSPVSELKKIKGIGESAAVYLNFLGQLTDLLSNEQAESVKLGCSAEIIDYCIKHYKNYNRECAAYFLLDANYNVIFTSEAECANSAECGFNFPEIVNNALNRKSPFVLLAHNHLSGCSVASSADIAVTRSLADVLRKLNVRILDHIIVSGDNAYSMRAFGGFTDIWR